MNTSREESLQEFREESIMKSLTEIQDNFFFNPGSVKESRDKSMSEFQKNKLEKFLKKVRWNQGIIIE